MTKDPWRCLNCSKLNRFNINCCGDYGGHWEDFLDHSIVPPSQQGQKQHKQATKYRNPSPRRPSPRRTYTSWLHEEPWNGQDWGEAYQEGNGSPRQRTTSPRLNCSEESQETKATQASEGRRQGETKLQRQARDCASSMGGQRNVESCASSSSSNSCTIQSRNKIAGACDCDEQEEGHPGPRPSKSVPRGCATAESKCYLMCAARSHGDVKTFLEARKARANLHASWKQYLDAAITTWKGFLEDFDKEDRKLEEQIELAKTSLATAQEVLQDEADSRGSAWTMEVPNHPPNCCYAAFWRGRSLDVSVSGQWPNGQSGSLLKWTHSILSQ